MVFASCPVDSLNRFAARPVGVQYSTFNFKLLKIYETHLIMVVFPVPGPPVTMVTPPLTAEFIASRWLG